MANMDVLKALDDLKAAGVEERSARAMIRLVSDAVELQAATKNDLERECGKLRAALSSEIAEFRTATGDEFAAVRSEMAEFRAATGDEFAAVRGEIAEFRTATGGEFAAVRSEIADLRTRMQQDFKSLRADVAQDLSGLRIELVKELGAIRDNLNARLLTVVGLQFGGTALLLGGFYALLRQ